MNTTLDQVLARNPVMSDPDQNETPEKYLPGTKVSYKKAENVYIEATIKRTGNTSGIGETAEEIQNIVEGNKVWIEYTLTFGGEGSDVNEELVDLDKIAIPLKPGTPVRFEKPSHCSVCGLKLCLSNCDSIVEGIIQKPIEVDVVNSWKYWVKYNDNLIKITQNDFEKLDKVEFNWEN